MKICRRCSEPCQIRRRCVKSKNWASPVVEIIVLEVANKYRNVQHLLYKQYSVNYEAELHIIS